MINCPLAFTLVDVILLTLESCFAFHPVPIKNVTRKLKKSSFLFIKIVFSRFNGTSFKTEPPSKFSHRRVYALGSYRDSVFVTGHNSKSSRSGLKTEILDYKAKKWIQGKDYPFSNGIS